MREVSAGNVTFGNARPLVLIAGPCQLESLEHSRMLAERLLGLCRSVGIGYVFKASYDKANRSSVSGQRGVGIDAGLQILARPWDEGLLFRLAYAYEQGTHHRRPPPGFPELGPP